MKMTVIHFSSAELLMKNVDDLSLGDGFPSLWILVNHIFDKSRIFCKIKLKNLFYQTLGARVLLVYFEECMSKTAFASALFWAAEITTVYPQKYFLFLQEFDWWRAICLKTYWNTYSGFFWGGRITQWLILSRIVQWGFAFFFYLCWWAWRGGYLGLSLWVFLLFYLGFLGFFFCFQCGIQCVIRHFNISSLRSTQYFFWPWLSILDCKPTLELCI